MRAYLYSLVTDQRKGVIAGTIKFFLFLLSLIYGVVVRLLITFYRFRQKRFGCKVISIGNITLGGTGKTSLVEFIAKYLKAQGHKVSVISRGYKRESADCRPQTVDHRTMGDEPYMLSQNLKDIPVVVDSDRVRGINKAIKDYMADTVILDDSLQQWRLKKDLEIVTIDATDPFGNGQLLPRGILREPLSALKRADLFILTKVNLSPDTQSIKDFLVRVNPGAQIVEARHEPLSFYSLDKPDTPIDLAQFKGKAAAIFSGIGDPDSFASLIGSLGISAAVSFNFSDHYNYTQGDLDNISKQARAKNVEIIITTQKDAARLSSLELRAYSLQLLVLRIQMRIKDEQKIYHRLSGLYSR